MPRKVTYSCEVCEAVKQESNHWFVVVNWFADQPFELKTWKAAKEGGVLDENGTVYLCGQQCAHKLLDEFFEELTKKVVDASAVKE